MLYTEIRKRRQTHVKSLLVRELEYTLRHALSKQLSPTNFDMYFNIQRVHNSLINFATVGYVARVHSYDLISINKVIDALS